MPNFLFLTSLGVAKLIHQRWLHIPEYLQATPNEVRNKKWGIPKNRHILPYLLANVSFVETSLRRPEGSPFGGKQKDGHRYMPIFLPEAA